MLLGALSHVITEFSSEACQRKECRADSTRTCTSTTRTKSRGLGAEAEPVSLSRLTTHKEPIQGIRKAQIGLLPSTSVTARHICTPIGRATVEPCAAHRLSGYLTGHTSTGTGTHSTALLPEWPRPGPLPSVAQS